MATKQQVLKALAKHAPGATLEDYGCAFGYQVQIEAPKGHHWDGGEHCRNVDDEFATKKAEFWDDVLEVIKELPAAVPCDNEDCEGIRVWGTCVYWEQRENQGE